MSQIDNPKPPHQTTAYELLCAKLSGAEMASDLLYLVATAHEKLHGTTTVTAAVRFSAQLCLQLCSDMNQEQLLSLAQQAAEGLHAR